MDIEKKLLLEAFAANEKCLKEVFDSMDISITDKSTELSEDSRNKGNELFKQKHRDAETHVEIFRYYCQSISLAPPNSEVLAKAYANRSAFLLYMHKLEDCIEDIDRAMNITKSDVMKIMLLCRKAECMKKLALPDYQSALDEVETHAKDIDSSNKARIDKLISKVKACTISDSTISRSENGENDILSQIGQIFDCISIQHNEKYGRHLIAKKDYNPGDFIFRDDLYATVLKPNMIYTNCNHCLKVCWSGIPCDHCSWAMFCSEDCKDKAWNAFHDVECSVIPRLEIVFHQLYFEHIKFSLRLLLVGIREAGSIDKLKEDLELVDQCTDPCHKVFFKNSQSESNTIQAVYSLTSREISKIIPDLLATNALIALISIVKNSAFATDIKLDRINDIVINEDLVFLGSLLIKFALIGENNIFSFSQQSCDCQRLKRMNYQCCDRGRGLSTLASLLNHSCNPNAARIFTEDRKINIYAIQPIKKNSQIFVTYTGFYYHTLPMDRNRALEKYNFICECEACVESWPPLFLLPCHELMAIRSVSEQKLLDICTNIFEALEVNTIHFDGKDVEKLCKTIVQTDKRLTKPSYCMALMEESLLKIYSRIYGWKSPIHAFEKFNSA